MTPAAIAIIQARMSSSRLPGKVLMPLAGQPMIWHIAQRALACHRVSHVVVATSTDATDDPLANFCKQSGIDCHRGSLPDVLGRFLQVLDGKPYKYCVRITGDCPLIHPGFIDCQINALQIHDADMIWMETPAPLLAGQGVHSVRSLREVAEQSSDPDDREHVGSRFFAEHPKLFRLVGVTPPPQFQDARWRITVDEPADYKMMSMLYEALWHNQKIIPLEEALVWLEEHPEQAINMQVNHSKINRELAAVRADQLLHPEHQHEWNNS